MKRPLMELKIGGYFEARDRLYQKIEPVYEANCCSPKYNCREVGTDTFDYLSPHLEIESEGPFIR
jgi:hypothetical protein